MNDNFCKLFDYRTSKKTSFAACNLWNCNDSAIAKSIRRFAGNTRGLLELAERLTEKGIESFSKKEAIHASAPTGKCMLTVFSAAAERERVMCKEEISAASSMRTLKLSKITFY